MQLAQDLKAAGIDTFPCSITWNPTKQKYEKHPRTVNGEPWADTARRPIDDPAVQWQGSNALGIPIPLGVLIVDLDTYKPGCSTQQIDALFGVSLPWDQALIQTTVSGGSHYAFRAPGWSVKQGDNLGGPGSGIDTRVAGLGFICSGEGYQTAGAFGLMALAFPEHLPALPDACRPLLEKHDVPAQTPAELPTGNRDIEHITAALTHVDPDCSRDEWRNIGMALKHQFHDDPDTGYALWDAWSAGQFSANGAPTTYEPTSQRKQWNGFKAAREGSSITVATLYHMAMVSGWQPPAQFDTSMAFGTGAAPSEIYDTLIDRIMGLGGDSRRTEELMQDITTSGCNEIQALLLRNELKAMLKSAKLLDKDVAAAIDKQLTPKNRTVASTEYDKNHTLNAKLFIDANYPGDTLFRCDEVWYAFDGRSWVELTDAAVMHQLTVAMMPSFPQSGVIAGTYQLITGMLYRTDVRMNENNQSVILFQNGVLDLYTGNLLQHDKQYMTTKIAPYNFSPGAQAPTWHKFIYDVFEGDQQRHDLIQEWFGYMLSPSYQYQKIMLMIGPRRAGKSIIGKIVGMLVGALNFSGATLESFADDDFLDSLRGKTVAFSGDTAKHINRQKIERVIERIKKISGGDEVDFGRKYKSRMTCTLPTRIMLSANHVPQLFDDSEALAHRMLVLPFEVSYADREDPYLINKLMAEIEGIAAWALQGLARLNANGRFTIPEASRIEMDFIAEQYSPLRGFIEKCCVLGGTGKVSSTDLYEVYRAWSLCEQEPRLMARKVFISNFKDVSRGHGCSYGPQRFDDKVRKGFKGISLVDELPSATGGAFVPRVV